MPVFGWMDDDRDMLYTRGQATCDPVDTDLNETNLP
jgi:hypothetical protein